MKYIGFNNGVIDARETVVSTLDHGFLYGIGLFETFRTYGEFPFAGASFEAYGRGLQGTGHSI